MSREPALACHRQTLNDRLLFQSFDNQEDYNYAHVHNHNDDDHNYDDDDDDDDDNDDAINKGGRIDVRSRSASAAGAQTGIPAAGTGEAGAETGAAEAETGPKTSQHNFVAPPVQIEPSGLNRKRKHKNDDDENYNHSNYRNMNHSYRRCRSQVSQQQEQEQHQEQVKQHQAQVEQHQAQVEQHQAQVEQHQAQVEQQQAQVEQQKAQVEQQKAQVEQQQEQVEQQAQQQTQQQQGQRYRKNSYALKTPLLHLDLNYNHPHHLSTRNNDRHSSNVPMKRHSRHALFPYESLLRMADYSTATEEATAASVQHKQQELHGRPHQPQQQQQELYNGDFSSISGHLISDDFTQTNMLLLQPTNKRPRLTRLSTPVTAAVYSRRDRQSSTAVPTDSPAAATTTATTTTATAATTSSTEFRYNLTSSEDVDKHVNWPILSALGFLFTQIHGMIAAPLCSSSSAGTAGTGELSLFSSPPPSSAAAVASIHHKLDRVSVLSECCSLFNSMKRKLANSKTPFLFSPLFSNFTHSHALLDLYALLWYSPPICDSAVAGAATAAASSSPLSTSSSTAARRFQQYHHQQQQTVGAVNASTATATTAAGILKGVSQLKVRLLLWFTKHGHSLSPHRSVEQIFRSLEYFDFNSDSPHAAPEVVERETSIHITRLLLLCNFNELFKVLKSFASIGDAAARTLSEIFQKAGVAKSSLRFDSPLLNPHKHENILASIQLLVNSAASQPELRIRLLQSVFARCVNLLCGNPSHTASVINEVFPNCNIASFILGFFWTSYKHPLILNDLLQQDLTQYVDELGDLAAILFRRWCDEEESTAESFASTKYHLDRPSVFSLLHNDVHCLADYLLDSPTPLMISPILISYFSADHHYKSDERIKTAIFFKHAQYLSVAFSSPSSAAPYVLQGIVEARNESIKAHENRESRRTLLRQKRANLKVHQQPVPISSAHASSSLVSSGPVPAGSVLSGPVMTPRPSAKYGLCSNMNFYDSTSNNDADGFYDSYEDNTNSKYTTRAMRGALGMEAGPTSAAAGTARTAGTETAGTAGARTAGEATAGTGTAAAVTAETDDTMVDHSPDNQYCFQDSRTPREDRRNYSSSSKDESDDGENAVADNDEDCGLSDEAFNAVCKELLAIVRLGKPNKLFHQEDSSSTGKGQDSHRATAGTAADTVDTQNNKQAASTTKTTSNEFNGERFEDCRITTMMSDDDDDDDQENSDDENIISDVQNVCYENFDDTNSNNRKSLVNTERVPSSSSSSLSSSLSSSSSAAAAAATLEDYTGEDSAASVLVKLSNETASLLNFDVFGQQLNLSDLHFCVSSGWEANSALLMALKLLMNSMKAIGQQENLSVLAGTAGGTNTALSGCGRLFRQFNTLLLLMDFITAHFRLPYLRDLTEIILELIERHALSFTSAAISCVSSKRNRNEDSSSIRHSRNSRNRITRCALSESYLLIAFQFAFLFARVKWQMKYLEEALSCGFTHLSQLLFDDATNDAGDIYSYNDISVLSKTTGYFNHGDKAHADGHDGDDDDDGDGSSSAATTAAPVRPSSSISLLDIIDPSSPLLLKNESCWNWRSELLNLTDGGIPGVEFATRSSRVVEAVIDEVVRRGEDRNSSYYGDGLALLLWCFSSSSNRQQLFSEYPSAVFSTRLAFLLVYATYKNIIHRMSNQIVHLQQQQHQSNRNDLNSNSNSNNSCSSSSSPHVSFLSLPKVSLPRDLQIEKVKAAAEWTSKFLCYGNVCSALLLESVLNFLLAVALCSTPPIIILRKSSIEDLSLFTSEWQLGTSDVETDLPASSSWCLSSPSGLLTLFSSALMNLTVESSICQKARLSTMDDEQEQYQEQQEQQEKTLVDSWLLHVLDEMKLSRITKETEFPCCLKPL